MPQNYDKGSSIFEEGEEIAGIYYLLEGKLNLIYRFETDNQAYEFLFSEIQPNTFFAIENYFNESHFAGYSVKAPVSCNVNQTPLENKEQLEKIMREKPSYGVQILRSILRTITQTANFIIQIDKLWANLSKLEMIGQGALGYLSSKYNLSLNNEDLKAEVLEIFDFFQKNKVDLYPLSQKVFSAPFESYINENLNTQSLNKTELSFFTRLYSLPSEVQNLLYSKEPSFLYYFTEKASLYFLELLEQSELYFKKIIEKYSNLFKPQGVIHSLILMKNNANQNTEIINYLKLTANTLLTNIDKLSTLMKSNAPEYYQTLLSQIEQYKKLNMQEIEDAASLTQGEEDNYPIPEELKNSYETILKYAELDEEIEREFREKYTKFKMMSDKLSGDDGVRKFRNKLTDIYWVIYEKCFTRYYLSGGTMPKPVELMLRFGFFDEELIHPKTIKYIYEAPREKIADDLPIYDALQWMEKIASKELEPSMSGMGEPYEKYLREEAKRLSRKTLVEPSEIDTQERRVTFEITNLIKECAKVCSGEIFNYSPILMEEAFAGQSYRYFMPKKKIREEFFQIRSVDFGAFFREVRYRNVEENIEEFVQKEVISNIILLPSWGKRPMVWQVKERAKESRGRIILPHFIMDGLNSLFINVFGYYRWEIVKEILGPLWNDISKMSLTAEYTDYIQGYRKNKDLSLETKEKIQQEFKKFRSDRDRFVNDYSKWIGFESQGRPMANKVIRGMFYRQIPFSKEIREKVKDLPAYAEIHNRFINIRRKEIRGLQNKYQKYTKNGKTLPQELQDDINFKLM